MLPVQPRVRRASAVVPVLAVVLTACQGPARGESAELLPGPNPLRSSGARSGLLWNSSLFPLGDQTAAGEAAAVAQLEVRRGRLPLDVEQIGQTWNGGVLDALDVLNPDIIASIDAEPFEAAQPIGQGWRRAANGFYDNDYRRMGTQVKNKRPGRPVVLRMAWEFNGSSFRHRAVSSSVFIAGWRRMYEKIKEGYGANSDLVVISWSLSELDDTWGNTADVPGEGGNPLTRLWPGNAYVDLVGLDTYDAVDVTTTDVRPAKAAVYNRIYDFAKAHGKWFAIEEWGLHHTNPRDYADGGDNPHFIAAMYRWMNAHRDILAYEHYFQDESRVNVNSALFTDVGLQRNPKSAARYREVIRAYLRR